MDKFTELMQARENPHVSESNIRFFDNVVEDKEATEKAGYVQHKEVEMIEVRIPSGEITVREVREQDKETYPRKYMIFRDTKTPPETGTYLAEWPMISRARYMDLMRFKIKTVEGLAEAPEDGAPRWLLDLKDKAEAWLKIAKGSKSQVTARDKKIKDLEELLKQKEELIFKLSRRVEESEGIRLAG